MGDKGPLSGPTIDGDVCCSSKCWQCGFGGITVCRGTNAPGKPNTREWSRSVGTGERGEKAGGVGGKLPGGVIHPASDGHVVGQLILDIRFLPIIASRRSSSSTGLDDLELVGVGGNDDQPLLGCGVENAFGPNGLENPQVAFRMSGIFDASAPCSKRAFKLVNMSTPESSDSVFIQAMTV